MKRSLELPLVGLSLLLSGVLGCGGGSSGSTSGSTTAPPLADWTAATPTTVPSASLTDIEVTGPVTVAALGGGAAAAQPGAAAVSGDLCHPALFQRTYEMTDILNVHTHRMMDRIKAIIQHPRAPDRSPSCTVDDKSAPTQISCTIDPANTVFAGYPLTLTWQKSAANGATRYVTNVYIQSSSTPAAQFHQCELGVTPAPTSGSCSGATCPACTTIFSSTLDVTTSANGFDVASPSGTPVSFDFTSLNAVDPSETATGTIQVNVDFAKDSTKPNPFRRVLGFTFDNFVPALTAAEMAAGEANHGARNGTYAHVGYTGSGGGGGGAIAFVDEAILFCPQYAGEPSPPTLYSDALTLGRWYLSSGTLFSRVDAEAVGDAGGTTPTGMGGGNAQLPAGTSAVGAVCHDVSLAAPDPVADAMSDPWMFLEASGGAPVSGTYYCGPLVSSACATACGGAFGTLPSVSGSAIVNPYDFGSFSPNLSSSGIPTDSAVDRDRARPAPLRQRCGHGLDRPAELSLGGDQASGHRTSAPRAPRAVALGSAGILAGVLQWRPCTLRRRNVTRIG